MKRKEFLKEIAGFDKGALQEKANKLAEDLMRLRFKQGAKQLEKGHLLGQTRKALARVQTALTSAKSGKGKD
ncbi:MAG: 50S ribosomal protein L29 [Proteobacteria bacterium]|nr:50S ribosomal protein L29 [Pseudomonadota bacterium]